MIINTHRRRSYQHVQLQPLCSSKSMRVQDVHVHYNDMPNDADDNNVNDDDIVNDDSDIDSID